MMRVLQIRLCAFTAMDIVAYGDATAGICVSPRQYVYSGQALLNAASALLMLFDGPQLALVGVLPIILLSASFFLPLRQHGSCFHVAMNSMTLSKKIFAMLGIIPSQHFGTENFPGGPVSVDLYKLVFFYDDDASLVLKKVNLTIPARLLTVVVGEAGSSKSTLVVLIAGELCGYSGSIKFQATDPTESSKSVFLPNSS